MKNKGLLIVVSGFAGSGKGTIMKELINRYKEIKNITVTELVKRANITRGSFYSHYDSIFDVAGEIESDLQITAEQPAYKAEDKHVAAFQYRLIVHA